MQESSELVKNETPGWVKLFFAIGGGVLLGYVLAKLMIIELIRIVKSNT